MIDHETHAPEEIKALLDSVRCSFETAVDALEQAGVNLGALGLGLTQQEVLAVVEDLRKAITTIDSRGFAESSYES